MEELDIEESIKDKYIKNKYNGRVHIKSDLKEGEYFCSKCEGRGVINSSDTLSQLAYKCPKCNGIGIVDWIEQVVGKPQPIFYGTSGWGVFNQGASDDEILSFKSNN